MQSKRGNRPKPISIIEIYAIGEKINVFIKTVVCKSAN